MTEIRPKGRGLRQLPVLRTVPYPPFALILRAIWFGALGVFYGAVFWGFAYRAAPKVFLAPLNIFGAPKDV